MVKPSQSVVQLRTLLNSRLAGWGLAWLLGSITLLSAIGLLALSGWFITAAALAGLVLAGGHSSLDIFVPAALIRFFALARTVGRYAERLASHDAALGLLRDLRTDVFQRIGRSERLLDGTAATMHRLVVDVDLLDQFPLRVILPWGWASLVLVVTLSLLAFISPHLLWAASPGLLVAWLLPWLGYWQGGQLAREDVMRAEQRRDFLIDSLHLLTPLLIWQRWGEREAAFANQDQDYLNRQQAQQRLTSQMALAQQWALGASMLSMLWFGWPLIASEAFGVPLLLAALLVVLGLNEALLPLAGSFIALGLSQAARDRLNALTDRPESRVSTESRPSGPWTLQLDRVSARWPGALDGPDQISFHVQQGDTLLLQGPSGTGKSTLLQLLAGDPVEYQGQRLLNGQPYTDWDLRDVVGYLPQDVDIFDLSLAENLRLGDPDASDAQLWQVLDEVGLNEWALANPEQLHARMGEGGTAVSGGQARRIALARLLLAQRPVLLLDEPFAGLDAITRDRVMAALVKHQQDGLLVIVSHQPVCTERLQQVQV